MRNEIYGHVFVIPRRVTLEVRYELLLTATSGRSKGVGGMGLLCTCNQVNKEATPILSANTTFHLILNDNKHFLRTSRPIRLGRSADSSLLLRRVQIVELVIDAWDGYGDRAVVLERLEAVIERVQ